MSKKRKKTKTLATHGSGKERRTVRQSARRPAGIPDWAVSAPVSEPPSSAVVAGRGQGGWSLARAKPGLKKGTAAAALLGVVCVGAVVPAAFAQQAAPSPQPLVAAPMPEVSTGRLIAAGEIPFDPAGMVSAGGPEDAQGGGSRLEKFFSSMLSEALLPSISLADAMVAGVGGDELAAAYEDEVSGAQDAVEPADDEPGVEFASRGPEANRNEPLRSSDEAGDFLTPSLGGDPGTPEEIARSSPEDYADESPAAENSSPEEDASEDLAGMGIPGRSPERSEPGREPSGYELASYQTDEGSDAENSPGTESGEYEEEGMPPDSPGIGEEPAVDAGDEVMYVVPVDENSGDESPHGDGTAGEEVHGEEIPRGEGDFGLAPEAEPEVVLSSAPPDGSSDGSGSPEDSFGEHPPEISDEVDGEDVTGGGIENGPGADEETELAVQDYLVAGDGEEVSRLVSEKTTPEIAGPPQDEAEQEVPPDDEPPVTEEPHQTASPGEEAPPQDGVPAEDTQPEDVGPPDGGAPPEGRDTTPRTAPDSPESREPDPASNSIPPDDGEPGDEPDADLPGPGSPDGGDPHRPGAATPEAERPDGGGPRPSGTPHGAPAPEAERQRGARPHGSPEDRRPRHDLRGTERQDRGSADEAAGEAGGSPSDGAHRDERNDASREEPMIRVASDGRHSIIERVPPGGEPRRLHRAEMSFAEGVRLARDRYGGHPEGEFARLADGVSPEQAQTLAAAAPPSPPPAAMPTTGPARSHPPTSPPTPQPEAPETTVYQVAPEGVESLPAWQVRPPAVDHQGAAGQAAIERPLAVAQQHTQEQFEAQQPTDQPAGYGRQVAAQPAPVVEQAPVQLAAYDQQVGAQPEPTYTRPSWQTSTVPQNVSQVSTHATPQPPTQAEVQPQPQPWTAPRQTQPIPEPEPQTALAATPTVQPAVRQATVQTSTAEPTLDPAASRTVQSAVQPANPAGQSVSRTVVSSAEGGW